MVELNRKILLYTSIVSLIIYRFKSKIIELLIRILRSIYNYRPSSRLLSRVHSIPIVDTLGKKLKAREFTPSDKKELFKQHFIRGPLLYQKGGIEHAHSHYDPETKTLIFFCTLGKKVCGHPGIIHGGLISGLFDDIFGELFYSNADGKYLGFTAYLKIDYRNKMPAGKTIAFVAKITRQEGRKVFVNGEARDASEGHQGLSDQQVFSRYVGSESTLFAQGEALFIIPKEDYAKMDKDLSPRLE
jgi:acyl-coenzyme A thioesterase PaaI-like protein